MAAQSQACLLVCSFALFATVQGAFAEVPQAAVKRAPVKLPTRALSPAPMKSVAPVAHPCYWMFRNSIQQSGSLVHTWDLQPDQSVGPVPYHHSYKSLADPTLRQWVSHLPANASIICGMWLGPCRLPKGFAGDSPALEAEIHDFTKYCKSKQVVFCPAMNGG